MKKLIWLLAVAILFLLAGCRRYDAAPWEVSASYIENASCWPFFVAMEKGLFDRMGVKVRAKVARDSSEALNMLIAGKVDVSIENTYSALFSIEARSPRSIRLFLPCSETQQKHVSHLLVPLHSPVTHPSELKGKRIGTYTGATQLLTLKLFVRTYLGWDPDKDVQIVQVAPALQGQALEARQYDALFTIEPFASAALVKGIAKDILPYARGKILDPFPAGACSTRWPLSAQKRSALGRLTEALIRAADYIDRNPDQSRQILAKWTNLDPALAARVGGYEYHGWADFDAGKLGQVQRLADLYFEGRILERRLDVAGMFLSKTDLR